MGLVEKGLEFLDRISERAGYKNEWIVVREADTASDYGVLPYQRKIEDHINYGVINLDKPPGPTSHEVTAWVKKLFGVQRAGHGGTLDPKVTGVLPIGLANSTKVIGSVVHTVKEYVMVVQLHGSVQPDKLREAIEYFKGRIYQKPPLRSSVKRTVRVKNIYEIEVLDYNHPFILMRVICDPGTYMRKLAHDLGLVLGVGSHMRELRRTRTGPFKEDETLVTLQEVSEAVYLWKSKGDERYLRKVIMPVEVSVVHLPKIVVLDTAVDAIAHGANLAAPGVARVTSNVKTGERVAIFTLKGELVALAKALKDATDIAKMDRGYVAETERVIMPRGVYPRAWKSKAGTS